MSDSNKIRSFLLKERPEIVRVIGADGDEHDIPTMPGNGKSVRWRDVADTVAALRPARVEAHSSRGLLGVLVFDEQHQQTRAPEQVYEPATVPAALKDDPSAAMLTHFANLLSSAYRHATEVAFSKLVEVVQHQQRQASEAERRYAEAEAARLDEVEARLEERWQAVEEAKAESSPVTELLGSFVQGQTMAKGGK